MKATLTTYQAATWLADNKDNGFTRAGAFALIEYLEEIESDCGEEIEFDAVAIRCDYSEYADLADFAACYFADNGQRDADAGIEEDDSEETIEDKLREYIQDNGQLIEFDGGIIVSAF